MKIAPLRLSTKVVRSCELPDHLSFPNRRRKERDDALGSRGHREREGKTKEGVAWNPDPFDEDSSRLPAKPVWCDLVLDDLDYLLSRRIETKRIQNSIALRQHIKTTLQSLTQRSTSRSSRMSTARTNTKSQPMSAPSALLNKEREAAASEVPTTAGLPRHSLNDEVIEWYATLLAYQHQLASELSSMHGHPFIWKGKMYQPRALPYSYQIKDRREILDPLQHFLAANPPVVDPEQLDWDAETPRTPTNKTPRTPTNKTPRTPRLPVRPETPVHPEKTGINTRSEAESEVADEVAAKVTTTEANTKSKPVPPISADVDLGTLPNIEIDYRDTPRSEHSDTATPRRLAVFKECLD
jgi:hypothetical protein